MVSSKAETVADYLAELAEDRRAIVSAVRDMINAALPVGYRETMAYGMIGWGVPLEDYPDTYNGQPLAYAALAAQKNGYSLYLNCVYSDPRRIARLQEAARNAGRKLDMGKSCIRFRRIEDLPLEAIAAEIAAVRPKDFIAIYEQARQSPRG